MVRIVTDSSSDIPRYLAEELNITVLPARILFGRHAYLDGIEMPVNEFYRRLQTTKYHPVTTPTSPADIHSLLKDIEEMGEDILIITLPESLSKFQESIRIAVRDITRVKTQILDSTGTSMYQGLLVIQAAKLARLGLGIDQITEEVQLLAGGTILYAIVNNLTYLVRGGRIGVATQKIGSLLKINPILEVNDGEVESSDRARGMIKGIQRTVHLLDQQYNKTTELICSVIHSEAPILAAHLTQLVKDKFTVTEFIPTKIGPTIGANVGPYAVGVALSPVSRYFNGVDPEKYKLRKIRSKH